MNSSSHFNNQGNGHNVNVLFVLSAAQYQTICLKGHQHLIRAPLSSYVHLLHELSVSCICVLTLVLFSSRVHTSVGVMLLLPLVMIGV